MRLWYGYASSVVASVFVVGGVVVVVTAGSTTGGAGILSDSGDATDGETGSLWGGSTGTLGTMSVSRPIDSR